MLGWHYTSQENYDSMLLDGYMRAYHLDKPELWGVLGTQVGIWVFTVPCETELDLIGSVLFQAQRKQTFEIVELAVQYGEEDEQRPVTPGETLEVTHRGTLNSWVYHEGKPSQILQGPIPVERIEKTRSFDIRNILRPAGMGTIFTPHLDFDKAVW